MIIDSQQRCLHQWNPYSGSFPIESQLSLSQSLDHHRWVLDSFEARMRCLYDGIHEMTHQVLAQLGLMGLLRSNMKDLTAFHTLSEALAVLVGDLYAHQELIRSGRYACVAHRVPLALVCGACVVVTCSREHQNGHDQFDSISRHVCPCICVEGHVVNSCLLRHAPRTCTMFHLHSR